MGEWGKIMFDEWFVFGPDKAASFLKDKNAFFEKSATNPREELTTLKLTKKWIDLATDPSVDKCIAYMLDIFLNHFRNKIKNLINAFPKDARTKDKVTDADLGTFWHGHKRFPQVREWDASTDENVQFFYHSVNILVNQVFDLKIALDEATIKEKLAAVTAPEWVLSEETIDFEKDDAKNHHIDIITSATNLRAWNYTLEETTHQHVRMIAGKIIPAIATTTACITGFIGLEVMKHAREAPLDSYRMATINLAVNSFVLENLPDPIKKVSGMDPETAMECKAVPEGFTTWDFIEMKKPDVTLQEFIDELKKCHHDCTLTLLGDEEKVFYDDSNTESNKEKLPKKLLDIYKEILGVQEIFPPGRDFIIFKAVSVEDKDGNDANVPKIKWFFK